MRADTDIYRNNNADSHLHAHNEPDLYPHDNADQYAGKHADKYACEHFDTNQDRNAKRDSHAHIYTNRKPYVQRFGHCNTHSYRDRNVYKNLQPYIYNDRKPHVLAHAHYIADMDLWLRDIYHNTDGNTLGDRVPCSERDFYIHFQPDGNGYKYNSPDAEFYCFANIYRNCNVYGYAYRHAKFDSY
jgi:hypothetical protein